MKDNKRKIFSNKNYIVRLQYIVLCSSVLSFEGQLYHLLQAYLTREINVYSCV